MSEQNFDLKALSLSDEELEAVSGGGMNLKNFVEMYRNNFFKAGMTQEQIDELEKGSLTDLFAALGKIKKDRKDPNIVAVLG